MHDSAPVYSIEFAIRTAELWRVGKMIGGDEDAVRNALLDEVIRLRQRCSQFERRIDACNEIFGEGNVPR